MMKVVPDVLKEGGIEDRGENARLQCFIGARAIGDLIKTTLGPAGMDKILLPVGGEGGIHKATVTNDGATILGRVWIDNPAAKILIDMSKMQDNQCGDGTTGVVVLASELLREAELLLDRNIHPQTVIQGYRLALNAARTGLQEIAFDSSANPDLFRKVLINIARTTLSSKLLTNDRDFFANLCVDAVMRLKNKLNLDLIQIIKKSGGVLQQSYLEDGFVLEKKIGLGQPKQLMNCNVMIANTAMDHDKIKIYGARVQADSFDTVAAVEEAERQKMKQKVDKIVAHGCNVFINRQLIYDYPEQLFKQAGVMSIEHSDFDGMERLASCLGGEIMSTFDSPETAKLGHCAKIDEIMIGEDRLIRFSACEKNEACTIILRGANDHILDEAERSIHDALAILSQTVTTCRAVGGAGCSELWMSNSVDKLSRIVEGKKSLAIEAYARALRSIPTIILDNGGFDSSETVSKLRALHLSGSNKMGVDITNGDVCDVVENGILESYHSKLSQICAASEAAEQILRVDEVIRCGARQRMGP